jgi:hypothetical protein
MAADSGDGAGWSNGPSLGYRRLHIDLRDTGGRRRLRFQVPDKRLQAGLGAFEMNFNSFLRVQHPSIQSISAGGAIDERTESHALHYSLNSDGTSTGHCVF